MDEKSSTPFKVGKGVNFMNDLFPIPILSEHEGSIPYARMSYWPALI